MSERTLYLAPFNIAPALAASIRDGGVAHPPEPRDAHDVIVVCDGVSEAPGSEWLPVCLCESENTAPQPTMELAIREGWRHLREHGEYRAAVHVEQPWPPPC